MKILPHLIIGLGNPGSEYENTYHNVGFLALDAIIANTTRGEMPDWKMHKKLFSYARLENAIFIKPLTFMNESGLAAKEALKKFDAAIQNLTVIHDESDLPIGEFKISSGKNAAGHRGVQSIIDHIGTNEFQRIRIGIRPVEEGVRKKASAFVLTRIKTREQATLEGVFQEIAKALP